MVAGEECAEGFVEELGDGFELEACVVAELDELAFLVVEGFDSVAEGGEFGIGVDGGLRGWCRGEVLECSVGVARSTVGALMGSAAGVVAQAVHGDAEEPGLEPALLGVGALGQGCRDGGEHGLGDLLGESWVFGAAVGECVETSGVAIDELTPGVLVPGGAASEEWLDRGLRWVRVGRLEMGGRGCQIHPHGERSGAGFIAWSAWSWAGFVLGVRRGVLYYRAWFMHWRTAWWRRSRMRRWRRHTWRG